MRDRSLDGDLAHLDVGLVLADDGVAHLHVVGHVGHLHGRKDLHRLCAEARGVNDLRLGDSQLQLVDLCLQVGLCLLGSIILRILTQIALVARLGDGCRSLRALYRLQLLELGYHFIVALL